MIAGETLVRFFTATLERAKLSARDAVFGIGLGLMGLLVLSGTLLMAVGFVLYGAAVGLGAVLGGRPWLGALVTGLLFIGAILISLKFAFSSKKKRSLDKEIKIHQNELEREILGIWKYLSETCDLEKLTQDHPWQATGAAAFIGFVAAQPFFFSILVSTGTDLVKEIVKPVLLEQIVSSLKAAEGQNAA